MPTAAEFVTAAMAYEGRPYVLGSEGDLDPGYDPSVGALDCSELVQVALADVGVDAPDGHWNQWRWCRDGAALIPVDAGVVTAGALLFVYDGTTNGHVAISRGDGSTIEARGRAYGTGVFPSEHRGWTHAGMVPGVDYSQPAVPAQPPATPSQEEDMARLVQCNDGDIAVFTTDGVIKSWVRNYDAAIELAALGIAQMNNGAPFMVSRVTLESLALIGPTPDYDSIPGGYTGPRSTR